MLFTLLIISLTYMMLQNTIFHRFFYFLCFILLIASCGQKSDFSVSKPQDDAEGKDHASNPTIWPVLYGGSEETDFLFWILINDNMTAIVESTLNDGSLGSETERTDYEYLACVRTGEGFVLKDPTSGEELYAAKADNGDWIEKVGLPFSAIVSWSHSSGTVWDTYAEERGWKKEIRVSMQVLD